jgi:hypothetical protein
MLHNLVSITVFSHHPLQTKMVADKESEEQEQEQEQQQCNQMN